MENITLHSLGIYSSWCYHKPSRTLFDCGESISLSMMNLCFGIERIMISHAHSDHINGLVGLIGIRNSVKGDNSKPLEVYYPRDNWGMDDLIDYIEKKFSNWLKFKLNFIPIDAGFYLDLGNNKKIKAFSSKHQKNGTTLVYKIEETRTRLKNEFVGKNIGELLASGSVKKSELNTSYKHVEFAYLLDTCGFDVEEIRDATEVIIDCTFLNEKDRDDPTHFSLDEVLKICEDANVKSVTLAHISPRYSCEDVKKVKKSLPEKYKIHHPIYKNL